MECVVCHETDVPRRKMAKTPCVSQHGYVACKSCLLTWFVQKLTCPLCARPAPISSCLRKTDVLARRRLRAARVSAKQEAVAQEVQDNERAARQLQQQEVLDYYDRVLRGQFS